MAGPRRKSLDVAEENVRLRARVAQLEDRLDHLEEHGAAAKALQQAEALHHDLMCVVSDVVLIADDAGRLTYVSPNSHLVFGHSPADIFRHGRVSFLLPANLCDLDLLEQRGEISNIACQIRDAVGRARDLLVTVRRSARRNGSVMYVCRDVTERRRLELDYELLSLTWERRLEERTSQLRENRDRYRRYVEGLRGEYLFYATAPDGTVTYVSPSVYAILGYAPEQVVGRNWREFVDPYDPMFSRLEEYERMRFAGAATPPFILAPVRHASGETRMLEFTDSQLADSDGRIVANEGICRDITQRLAAEDALRGAREELEMRVSQRTAELTAANDRLRESEQRYRSVVDDQFEFIIRWRDDGVRTFVNESYCRHCGRPREELIGSSFMPEILEDDRVALRQKLATLSLESPALVFEHRVVLANRRFQWQRWTHRALFDKQGSFIEFQSVGTDVTDRRKQEELAHERVVAGVQMQSLSDRERDVMRLVVLGDANKVIARKLGLSIKTIEKHRSSLMKKLRVRSVPELVRLALLAGDDEVH